LRKTISISIIASGGRYSAMRRGIQTSKMRSDPKTFPAATVDLRGYFRFLHVQLEFTL